MKIQDEILDELKSHFIDLSEIDLIKIRYHLRKYDFTTHLSDDVIYDYCGSNVNEIENIDYDNGYGLQLLFGYIWLKDGSWFERGEYDGSEWWRYVCINGPRKDITFDELD